MTNSAASIDPDLLLSRVEGMRRLAWRLVCDEARADDLVQETLVAALEKRPRADRPLDPWLASVLRRRASFLKRSEGRRAGRERQARPAEAAESAAELAERAEMHAELVRALTRLGEPQREALLLRYYEGLTPKEIARRLGVAGGTVRSRIHRGLEELRQGLDRRFEGRRQTWSLGLLPLGLEVRGRSSGASGLLASGLAKPLALVAALVAAALAVRLAGTQHESPAPGIRAAATEPAGESTSPQETHAAGRAAGAPSASGSTSRPVRSELPGPGPVAGPAAAGGERLTGRLVTAEGDPVPHYAFDVRPGAPGSEADAERLTSRADGTFESERSYEPGPLRITLVDHPDITGLVVSGSRVLMTGSATSLALPWDPSRGPLELKPPVGPTYRLELELPSGAALEGRALRGTLSEAEAKVDAGRPRWSIRAPVRFDELAAGPGKRSWIRFQPLRGLLAEDEPRRLLVETPDGLWGGEVVFDPGRSDGVLPVRLEPRAALTVLLRGRTISSQASVLIELDGIAREMEGLDRTLLDDGRTELSFRSTALPPGVHLVTVSGVADPVPDGLALLEAGKTHEHVIDLEAGPSLAALSGELRSTSGGYREPVWLLARDARGGEVGRLEPRWESSDSGQVARWSFEGLRAGSYTLELFAMRDHRRWRGLGQPLQPPVDGLVLTCLDEEPAGQLTLRVQDAKTGEPLTMFESEVSLEGCAVGQMVVRARGVELRFDVPLDVRGTWSVGHEGYETATGDETAFQPVEDGLEALILLEPEG